jgi:phenylalanyl-tRNA synthetase alpha chain
MDINVNVNIGSLATAYGGDSLWSELKNDYSNIPISIERAIFNNECNLHLKKNHPVEIIKNKIYNYFRENEQYKFEYFDELNPIVSVCDNFDKLLIPKNHSSRSKSDSYYINENYVLRTHTSAHQNELLARGHNSFIVTGSVFRKDEIDCSHYPIFHQMELLTIIDDSIDPSDEIKRILKGLVEYLFPSCVYRFNKDYFPFTDPSYEIEVEYDGKWLEILGCGVVRKEILEYNQIYNKKAVAFGLGLERLVMIFCNIPDIRILWSTHDRFLTQYSDGNLNKFVHYSTLECIRKDISFYINDMSISDKQNETWTNENTFFELLREYGCNMIQDVKLIDKFYNTKLDKHSRTYRVTYLPNDPDVKDPAKFTLVVNEVTTHLRKLLEESKLVILR